jgi:hypothetical protein
MVLSLFTPQNASSKIRRWFLKHFLLSPTPATTGSAAATSFLRGLAVPPSEAKHIPRSADPTRAVPVSRTASNTTRRAGCAAAITTRGASGAGEGGLCHAALQFLASCHLVGIRHGARSGDAVLVQLRYPLHIKECHYQLLNAQVYISQGRPAEGGGGLSRKTGNLAGNPVSAQYAQPHIHFKQQRR